MSMPNFAHYAATFRSSVAGQINSRLWESPIAGVAATIGMGTAGLAGVSSFLSTDGTPGQKADAGATAALKYGAGAAGLTFAGLIAVGVSGAIRAGMEGFDPGGNIYKSMAYGTGRNAQDVFSAGARRTGKYARSVMNEIRGGGWRTALARPGISGGLGALAGAAIGHHLGDGDGGTTAAGAVVGAGAGMAAGAAYKASKVWSKWGSGTRIGAVVALSAVLGGGIKALSGTSYGNVDKAESESFEPGPMTYGVRDRMDRMGARGSLVFGLHNGR